MIVKLKRCGVVALGGYAAATVAGSGAQDCVALRFTEATPNAIGLAHAEGVVTALLNDRALAADGLGTVFTHGSSTATLAVRVEEDGRIGSTACAVKLPFPSRRCWSRKLAVLWH